jgi:hypothetical protein
MSESRALAVLEVLVHLTNTLPDRYVIGSAEIPDDLAMDVTEFELGENWQTPVPRGAGAYTPHWRRMDSKRTFCRASGPLGNCVRNQSHPEPGAPGLLTNPVRRSSPVPF